MYRLSIPLALLLGSMVFHQRERSVDLPVWAKLFSQYTGTCTGYGFFGPRVGSAYVLEVDCYDGTGRLLARLSMPPLTHAEGQKRYHTFLDVFSALLEKAPTANHARQRYARAVAQCLARRIAALNGLSPQHIRYRVGVSRMPRLSRESAMPQFVVLYENEYRETDRS